MVKSASKRHALTAITLLASFSLVCIGIGLYLLIDFTGINHSDAAKGHSYFAGTSQLVGGLAATTVSGLAAIPGSVLALTTALQRREQAWSVVLAVGAFLPAFLTSAICGFGNDLVAGPQWSVVVLAGAVLAPLLMLIYSLQTRVSGDKDQDTEDMMQAPQGPLGTV
jgi:hypothetical protein